MAFPLLSQTLLEQRHEIGPRHLLSRFVADNIECTNLPFALAVGATQSAVQLQFLGEAVMLSLLGGFGGLLLSILGSAFIERLLGWPIATPWQAVTIAMFASAAIGVTFGFFPAWRASRLDPITALRSN